MDMRLVNLTYEPSVANSGQPQQAKIFRERFWKILWEASLLERTRAREVADAPASKKIFAATPMQACTFLSEGVGICLAANDSASLSLGFTARVRTSFSSTRRPAPWTIAPKQSSVAVLIDFNQPAL
jgi:hypothetical protein